MNNRKRILQANLKNQGGAFSVAYEAQKQLQEDYIFDYFFPDKFIKNDVYDHLISMGSRCVGELNCKNRMMKQYEIYKTFYQYLKENDYETVHIHSDTAWKICIYYLAAKKAKIDRIVVHSHSSGINGHFHQFNYLLHVITKPIIKSAKYRVACSDVAAKWMFDTTDNVTIIRNGVDIPKVKFNGAARKQVRQSLDVDDKIVIGSVSDFSHPKNPEFIFELIKEFKQNTNYIFLLVGNRPDGCKLKEWIDADDSIRNVIFAGTVTNVQDYLSSMDIFILPSRFEGLPMCALEAQVNGLYTIISDKVSNETKCSNHFVRMELDISKWKEKIDDADISYNRNNREKYLNEEKACSSSMSKQFKMIYEKE